MEYKYTCDIQEEKVKFFLLGLVIEKVESHYFQDIIFVNENIVYAYFVGDKFYNLDDAKDNNNETITLSVLEKIKTSDIVNNLLNGYTVFVNLTNQLKFDDNFISYHDLCIGFRKPKLIILDNQ